MEDGVSNLISGLAFSLKIPFHCYRFVYWHLKRHYLISSRSVRLIWSPFSTAATQSSRRWQPAISSELLLLFKYFYLLIDFFAQLVSRRSSFLMVLKQQAYFDIKQSYSFLIGARPSWMRRSCLRRSCTFDGGTEKLNAHLSLAIKVKVICKCVLFYIYV